MDYSEVEDKKYYMNPNTGAVDLGANWKSGYDNEHEGRNWDAWTGGGLLEVVKEIHLRLRSPKMSLNQYASIIVYCHELEEAVQKYSDQGYSVEIVGDPQYPVSYEQTTI